MRHVCSEANPKGSRCVKVQPPLEGYITSDQAAAGVAEDMAAPHGSFTMQLADGQHQQHDGFEQPTSMSYNEESASLTSEQLAAAYAASQAGFDPQAGFGPGTLGHHQIHPGKSQVASLRPPLTSIKLPSILTLTRLT